MKVTGQFNPFLSEAVLGGDEDGRMRFKEQRESFTSWKLCLMRMEGLDNVASRSLLEELDKVSEENMTGIIKAVGGHPLALELADSETGSDSFQDYIYEHVISLVFGVFKSSFNFSTLSIFSHGTSMSVLPKCPYEARIL